MTLILAVFTALWLGILTSISPCPLASNIAAVSYISRKLKKKSVILSGVLYTLGRMTAYTLISAVIVASIVSIPVLSNFLQMYMPKIVGPILILTGMFLLELISINLPGTKNLVDAEKYGLFAEFILGFIFAMALCPVSAALFFGSLIPLAVSQNSSFILPLFYGIGTALPVIVFSVLFSFGAEKVSLWFNRITAAELWIRKSFGVVMIGIGIYYSLKYIFEII